MPPVLNMQISHVTRRSLKNKKRCYISTSSVLL